MVRGSGFGDVHFQVQQFVGALHRFGREDLAHAQIDLDEVVNGDRRGERRHALRRLRGDRFAEQFGLLEAHLLFELAHFVDGFFQLDAREHARNLADLLAGRKLAPVKVIETHLADAFGHPELLPDLRRRFGHHRIEQRGRRAASVSADV